jgi:ATP-dependent protease ClpP protease subunit
MAEPVSLDELIEECEEALDAANDITDVMEESSTNLPFKPAVPHFPVPEQTLLYQNNAACIWKENTILLTEDICCDSYNTFIVAFRLLESQGKPINVILNTEGGDVVYMFSIYDLIRSATVPITIIGTGQVCSAGVLLLVAGHKRYVTENCVLMSHQGNFGMEGTFEEAKARLKWMEWTEGRWAELMARHTTRDSSYWKRVSKKEAELWVLGGANIVAQGFADAVVTEPMVKYFGQHRDD